MKQSELVEKYLREARPVSGGCGASSGQTDLAASQAAYYTTLQKNAQQEFGDASQVFKQMQDTYAPIFAAGPNQKGYSQGQLDSLNSAADTGVGQAYSAANKAVKENVAGSGGGNTLLPSGVAEKAAQSTAVAGASQLSNEQSQILNNDYAQGNANFQEASNALLGATNTFNASSNAAGAANTGGSDANSTYNAIAQENASPFNAVVGALGGIAGGIATGGISIGAKAAGGVASAAANEQGN